MRGHAGTITDGDPRSKPLAGTTGNTPKHPHTDCKSARPRKTSVRRCGVEARILRRIAGAGYIKSLGDRPAAGRRTTALVLGLTRASPIPGAVYRGSADATRRAATATWRMVRALRQNGCRANDSTAAQMCEA